MSGTKFDVVMRYCTCEEIYIDELRRPKEPQTVSLL